MKVVFGDIWTYPADCVVITTNGTVKKDGSCVMGRGVARQARQRYQGIEYRIGQALKVQGNHVFMMGDACTFPVKHNWWETADLELIRWSALELAALANQFPDRVFVMPRPGCGNGGLTWDQVRPVIDNVLPDNVHVIEWNETTVDVPGEGSQTRGKTMQSRG